MGLTPTYATITYVGDRVVFTKVEADHPAVRRMLPSQHTASLDDRHIEHPRLGPIDTAGDRFGAIVKTSGHLHGLQSGQRFAFEMRQRALNRAPILKMDDEQARELERQRVEREFDRLFGIE